jgi:hypothetical protein
MQTKRFAIDSKGKRIYIGSSVRYRNSTYLVEDMKFLSWSRSQYLTLCENKNKNKKVDFVLSSDVLMVYSRRQNTRNNKSG